MGKTELAKQLEFYSNSIIGFIVFQGLAFCYNFGTSKDFNAIVKATMSLSVGLIILFFISTSLAVLANHFLGQRLKELTDSHKEIINTVYIGKQIVICIFGLLPILVTIRYAIFRA